MVVEMELNQVEVYDFLKSKGIDYLYHANTVTTAITFLEQGGLLSRGAVERLNLQQTPQMSDGIDKEFGVWNDIFLDSNDLHTRFNRQNHYGPVLFKLNIDILLSPNLPQLWITRDNPTNWNTSYGENEKYFNSMETLKDVYDVGAFKEMITLRNTFEVLPFNPHLVEIILDDPYVSLRKENVIDKAVESLSEVFNECNYDYENVKWTIRECQNCYCRENYLNEVGASKLEQLFYT